MDINDSTQTGAFDCSIGELSLVVIGSTVALMLTGLVITAWFTFAPVFLIALQLVEVM